MRSNPPRRSRPPSDGGGIPFLPLMLGVIVLGFVIGAGLSFAGRRSAGTVALATPTAVQTLPRVTPAPTEQPTPLPTEAVTDAPSETPSNAPSDAPSISASAEVTDQPSSAAGASATSAPTSSAAPTASAEATASAAPTATHAHKVTAVPVETHRPKPQPSATEAPAAQTEPPAATPNATRTPDSLPVSKAPVAVPAASANADLSSDFPRLAAAVVRQYLAAVSRGDQDSAYAALGGSPGDRGVQLTEAGIVDAHTRIGNVESRGTSDAATVSVELHTPDGLYVGQYTVRRNDTGAAVIVAHSISK